MEDIIFPHSTDKQLYSFCCNLLHETQKSVGTNIVFSISSAASQLYGKAEDNGPTCSTGNTAFSPWTKLPGETWWWQVVVVRGIPIDCVLVTHAWIWLLKKELEHAETTKVAIGVFCWYHYINGSKCVKQLSFAVLLESRVVPWWAQEMSGSRGAPSSHRWILSLQPCSHHSTGSSSPHSESICRDCHSGGPRNFQLQPLPQYGCPWPPLVSVQCQHILKETKWFSKKCLFRCMWVLEVSLHHIWRRRYHPNSFPEYLFQDT